MSPIPNSGIHDTSRIVKEKKKKLLVYLGSLHVLGQIGPLFQKRGWGILYRCPIPEY